MRTACLALLVLAAACKPKPPPPAPELPGPMKGHRDLDCIEGTQPEGYHPPLGMEVYCVRVEPTGRKTRHGPMIGWHAEEARSVQGRYADGKETGKWTWWHENGEVAKSAVYKAGELDGFYVEYWPNGNKHVEGTYDDGREVGQWQYFDEEGNLATEGEYVRGLKEGEWTSYDAEGNPKTVRHYRGGNLRLQEELVEDPG